MFTLRRVFAFLAVAGFVLCGASRAQADTTASVTLSATGAVHTRQNRGGNLTNLQINRADCELDDAIKYSFSLSSNYSAYHLEVWAGQGCDAHDTRLSTTILNCWKVYSFQPTSINPDPITIPVKSILYGRTTISGNATSAIDLTTNGGTGGASAVTTAGTGGADSTAGANSTAGTGGTSGASATAGTSGSTASAAGDPCTDKNTETGAQSIIVYFMLVDGSNNSAGTIAQWTGQFKLQAPLPPDSVSAGIGENIIPLSFSYASTSSDMTINGYNFYCDPPAGSAAAADAGVLPVDGGPEPTCSTSTVLAEGAQVTSALDSNNRCGNAGKSATSGNATGLVDGVAYNVAIATTDTFSNVGVLSKVRCRVPQPVTGFFEAYTDAGGKGGGGFCSFSRRRETLTLFALLGCASCLFLRRRRAA